MLASVFLILFAGLLFNRYRIKQKANNALEKLNREIKFYNKEITDSINYARQIQTAILPANERILRALPDSFVLYKPKAIVSGDFYFFAEKNGRAIIAAVDCTGHGVPGAFMSMIGSNLLNQIIIEKGISKPDEILNRLHLGVREALKQDSTEGDQKDGMDICLCSIDTRNYSIEYAGANRPLFIFRDGVLSEIKANKFPIGGIQTEEERRFTNHQIQLKKHDSLYLFSDGFVDQFGGERGKKFMSKQFKQVLAGIQNLPLKKQEEQLDKTFENWRNFPNPAKMAYEQVDDILVIGLRL